LGPPTWTLTDIVPQLVLYDRNWPIWTFAEISPSGQVRADKRAPAGQAVFVAGLGRLHRIGSDGAAVAAVHQCPLRSPIRMWRMRHLPDVEVGAERGSTTSSSIAASAFRPGWSWAKTPSLDAARFRRTDGGICLITQPMIDKLGR
jgi:glucose-1-phosphate adenylyltransferase